MWTQHLESNKACMSCMLRVRNPGVPQARWLTKHEHSSHPLWAAEQPGLPRSIRLARLPVYKCSLSCFYLEQIFQSHNWVGLVCLGLIFLLLRSSISAFCQQVAASDSINKNCCPHPWRFVLDVVVFGLVMQPSRSKKSGKDGKLSTEIKFTLVIETGLPWHLSLLWWLCFALKCLSSLIAVKYLFHVPLARTDTQFMRAEAWPRLCLTSHLQLVTSLFRCC